MFADLVEGGMDPDVAVDQVANQLQADQAQTMLGNTAGAATAADIGAMVGGSPQAAQMGEAPMPEQGIPTEAPIM
jgi:hypothetical protein